MQQVRQSVNIARDLIDQFQRVVKAMARGAASDDADGELSVQRAEAERLYAGIWEHLDDAASKTAADGRSVEAFKAVRHDPSLDRAVGVAGVTHEVTAIEHEAKHDIVHTRGTVEYNNAGLELARRAVAALEAAWPELDWTPPPAEPPVDLRPKGFFARLFGR